jgi:hypothetical protein
MASFNDYYAVEDTIENLLRKELIGPVEVDEILSEPPLAVYSMGILWAQRTTTDKTKMYVEQDDYEIEKILDQQEDMTTDIDAIEDLDDSLVNPNGQINAANVYRPSAMALTMVAGVQEKSLNVRFKCSSYSHHEEEVFYEKRTIDDEGIESIEIKKRLVNKYTRNIIDCDEIVLDLNTKKVNKPNKIPNNISIELFVRKIYQDGSRLVTVSVINNVKAQNREVLQNTSALFQCHLSIVAEKGFLPIIENESTKNDIETETLNMLYRDTYNYASGHGCSVKWNIVNATVCNIESEFMPIAELLQMESRHMPNFHCFNMTFWNANVRERGCEELEAFITLYQKWLFEQKQKSHKIKSYAGAINNNFANIENCIERLTQGVEYLRSNNTAWKSFLYMNEAMIMQRVNYAKTKKKVINPTSVTWYPFQLAYILQVIPDIVDNKSDWRDNVDLLWFPTGGGKTEAYLGLAAFVIFFRKLSKGENGDGVTIIMRYTLRLLTAQQFERATALICACEYLRRKHSILGCEISIGLWVGMDLTPNNLERAKENIDKIREGEGETIHKENPVQIFHCPFCGGDIDIGNYKIKTTMIITCPNTDCEFHNGLPIYVVDEDIYNVRPTLLLSTIDKFARIVWEEKTVAIFGSDGVVPPPELIIQDELHLISGPLGSIYGLYESAVDELCTNNGIKPKIIASTATVRNAKNQIKALYNRKSFQFPPSGIDINDSFFAKTADKESRPARRYIGICETGGSLLDILIRVYGCMFFAINYLEAKGIDRDIIDQYFTVVGYFNSLKDLGSSATVIIDRVGLYSNSLRLHKFKKIAYEAGLEKINIHFYNELTSRKSSKEIKVALEELEIKYPDERAYSYILASNMLSVGIDVSRLGVMTVYSQPKTNAEYIQATSRVGRINPGLVMSLYNAMRSRDKSHYEQFIYYHQTFYKHVEPTSVTPFSFRAIEKALHSVYVALIRHKIPEIRKNQDVINYRINNSIVKEIKQFILGRIDDINSTALEYANDWLENFESLWEKAAKYKYDNFYYSLKNNMPDTTYTLLIEAEKDNLSDLPSTLNALRNVDSSSNVYILNRQDEGGQV